MPTKTKNTEIFCLEKSLWAFLFIFVIFTNVESILTLKTEMAELRHLLLSGFEPRRRCIHWTMEYPSIFVFLEPDVEFLVEGEERWPWSSSVVGSEGSYQPNCQTNLAVVLAELSLLFGNFINTTAFLLGWFDPSYPSSEELLEPVANLINNLCS